MDSHASILLFLTPKDEVAYLYDNSSVKEAMEKMERFRYTSIPILKRSGEYLGTITEGDLLWTLKNEYQFDYAKAQRMRISDLPRHSDNEAVTISTDMGDLIAKAQDQNFVPVEDDRGMFIGIVTRSKIIQYFQDKLERSLGDLSIA